MSRSRTLLLLAACLACTAACQPQAPATPAPAALAGDYLGQPPPGPVPALFAPGLVSTGMNDRDVAVAPAGDELYFSVYTSGFDHSAILGSRRVSGRWTAPEVASFSGDPGWNDLEPAFSADGARLYFMSNRPRQAGGAKGDEDIWVVERAGDGWGEPRNLGAPVNTEAGEYFPSLTRDGTLYFTREDGPGGAGTIYRTRPAGDGWAAPERLPEQVNAGRDRFNAFVAPDESFLIIPVLGRDDSIGSIDYYVVFRNADDTWQEPVNLGAEVNTPSGQEYAASLSPDGRYLFFMSSRTRKADGRLTRAALQRMAAEPGGGSADVYWVEAGFIAGLRR